MCTSNKRVVMADDGSPARQILRALSRGGVSARGRIQIVLFTWTKSIPQVSEYHRHIEVSLPVFMFPL
jgi:hypothetical protein